MQIIDADGHIQLDVHENLLGGPKPVKRQANFSAAISSCGI